MKIPTLLLGCLVLAAPACDHPTDGGQNVPVERAEDRVDHARQELEGASRKIVEASSELTDAKNAFSRAAHDRIETIDRRLLQLENEGDAEAKKASAELRAQRDIIAAKLRLVDQAAQAEWDQVKSDTTKLLDDLETRLGTMK